MTRTIDDYIAGCPESVKPILEQIRALVRENAHGATEAIMYQMPTFVLNGNLVHFAAFKRHIGLYPPVTGSAELRAEVARYEGPKGALRFPLDEPIPYDLIARIVRYRVAENIKGL